MVRKLVSALTAAERKEARELKKAALRTKHNISKPVYDRALNDSAPNIRWFAITLDNAVNKLRTAGVIDSTKPYYDAETVNCNNIIHYFKLSYSFLNFILEPLSEFYKCTEFIDLHGHFGCAVIDGQTCIIIEPPNRLIRYNKKAIKQKEVLNFMLSQLALFMDCDIIIEDRGWLNPNSNFRIVFRPKPVTGVISN